MNVDNKINWDEIKLDLDNTSDQARCLGLDVELVGNWLWLDDSKKLYSRELRDIGFVWSKDKGRWFYRPSKLPDSDKPDKKVSMDKIRQTYGSQCFNKTSQRDQTALKNNNVLQTSTRRKRYSNTKYNGQNSVKSISESLHFVTKLTEYQLEQMSICPEGEFYTCSTGKEALDMVNHIKSALRSKGFGCYALHNYVWIVPFVHQSLHMPDFERAKLVLPDLKSELLGKVSPNKAHQLWLSEGSSLKINKKTWLLVGGFVLILMLIF